MKDRQKNITIISRESNSRTLDISMLEAELKRRGANVRVMCRLLTKEKSLKALAYAGHVLKQEAAILASDVVVLDTYCIPASMISHRKGTKIVQMWHALGAVKQFGWQTVGKIGGSSEKTAKLMRMHHGYDYVVCCSDITAEYFSEAFKTDSNKIVKFGLPRIDYIKSVASGERQEELAAKICNRYPQISRTGSYVSATGSNASDDGFSLHRQPQGAKRRTVLYAPTFRKGRSVDVKSLADTLDPEKYDVVVKLHPLYRGDAEQQCCQQNVIFDEEFSSYDWLSLADIVISDYSSYVIESTLADKPLFIYAYDIDDYAKDTGLNIDFDSEPVAPYVFRDAKELAACIDAACFGSDAAAYDMNALREFRERYIDIDTDNCTAALAEFLLSL